MIRATPTLRRGTAYTLVLMTTMIVGILGVSGVALARIERARAQQAANFENARAIARAAVEWGTLQIRNEPTWHTLATRGPQWAKDVPFAGGMYCLTRTNVDQSDPQNPRLSFLAEAAYRGAVVKYRFTILRGAYIEGGTWSRVLN